MPYKQYHGQSHAQQNHLIQPTSYDVLGVPANASDADIKAAYRRLVLQWHPDKAPLDTSLADHNLKLINEAYSRIKTRATREQYNQILRLQKKAMALSNKGTGQNAWGKFWNWLTKLETKV